MRAVIDIGSNSVRLMIEREQQGLNEKQTATTRLGEALYATHKLSEASMRRSIDSIAAFYAQAKAAGCTEVYAFATEAIRAAENGSAFCRAVSDATGLSVEVLAPETEAQVGYLGATIGLNGNLAVLDVGGASTELAVGSDGVVLSAVSIPIGAVRLQSVAGCDLSAMLGVIEPLLDRLPDPHGATVVAIGGTATTLAAADLGLTVYDPHRVHRHTVTVDALDRLIDAFTRGDIPAAFPVISPRRAEIITQGAVIYRAICKRFGLSSFTVSETDNCEGFLSFAKERNQRKL